MSAIAKHSIGRAGRAAIACLACGLFGSAAKGETTATFDLAANVVAGCEVNGSPGTGQDMGRIGTLDFGEHSALATGSVTATLLQDASVVLSCTPSVALTMALDGGRHASGGRNLQREAGTSRIAYKLYRDAALGDELPIGQTVPISFGTDPSISHSIHGRLVLTGDQPPGVYRDTVVVTFAW